MDSQQVLYNFDWSLLFQYTASFMKVEHLPGLLWLCLKLQPAHQILYRAKLCHNLSQSRIAAFNHASCSVMHPSSSGHCCKMLRLTLHSDESNIHCAGSRVRVLLPLSRSFIIVKVCTASWTLWSRRPTSSDLFCWSSKIFGQSSAGSWNVIIETQSRPFPLSRWIAESLNRWIKFVRIAGMGHTLLQHGVVCLIDIASGARGWGDREILLWRMDKESHITSQTQGYGHFRRECKAKLLDDLSIWS